MNGKTGRLFVFRAFFVSESVLKNKKQTWNPMQLSSTVKEIWIHLSYAL